MKPRWSAPAAWVALILLILAPTILLAQTVDVPFRWTAPRTGAAVDHYNVYHVEDGGAPYLAGMEQDTTYVLAATRGVRHQIQVSGVSADGLEGPVSPLSDVVYLEIPQTGEGIPSVVNLRPNFPNPFNPQTTIVYGVPAGDGSPAALVLEIYDIRGQRVRRLETESDAGWHTVIWDGRDDQGLVRPSGQYFVRFACGGAVKTWKMTMLK